VVQVEGLGALELSLLFRRMRLPSSNWLLKLEVRIFRHGLICLLSCGGNILISLRGDLALRLRLLGILLDKL
jgi:hypothetical protein